MKDHFWSRAIPRAMPHHTLGDSSTPEDYASPCPWRFTDSRRPCLTMPSVIHRLPRTIHHHPEGESSTLEGHTSPCPRRFIDFRGGVETPG